MMLHGGGPGASAWSNFGAALPGFAAGLPHAARRPARVRRVGQARGRWATTTASPPTTSSQLLDELGIDRIHLLGNSLGGGTAMRLALTHPDRVGRLVLMGPGGLSLNLFHADPTEGVQRLMDFAGDPTREAMRAFISTMVVNQELVTDELVEERFADATAPGAQAAMASMGMSFWNPDDRRGRHALARGPPAAPAHPADLGSRGPGQPARRRDGRPQADPQGLAARLPQLWALGADRGGRGVPRGRHRVPGAARGNDHATTGRRPDDDRHPQHGLRPGRQHRPRAVEALRRQGARPRRGSRARTPSNLYFRIDEVSARLVVVPLRQGRAVLRRLGARRPPGAAGGARAPVQGRRGVRGGHGRGARRATGRRSWSGSPTRSTTSSSCSTASPTSRGRWSRRTPPRS